MEKKLNLIQRWLKKLRESDNQHFEDTIEKLETDLAEEIRNGLDLVNYIKGLNEDLAEQELEIMSSNKHSSIEAYKLWLDKNITAKTRYYDFGKGKKQVHTIFAESIKDEDIIRDFIKEDLDFIVPHTWSVDQMIFYFNKKLSHIFPTSKYYAYDRDLYGMNEYWATAKETILKLRNGGKSFDCDDSMTLRYSCLYYLLKDFFPEDAWRFRGFIVDIWTGGGHAMLAWLKEGPNDWIPVETTFYDRKQSTIWNNNYRIRSQMLYQIRYSFDHETEYERI